MTNQIPENLPGHWETPDGAEMAKAYASMERINLCGGDKSDMMVAFRTAMIRRDDFDFEAKLTVAKDRIRWLSVQLALANMDKAWLLEILRRVDHTISVNGTDADTVLHVSIGAAIAKATGLTVVPATEEPSISTPGALR